MEKSEGNSKGRGGKKRGLTLSWQGELGNFSREQKSKREFGRRRRTINWREINRSIACTGKEKKEVVES